MTLRLDDSQTQALRRRAEIGGRSIEQLAAQGAERFADLLRRLGE